LVGSCLNRVIFKLTLLSLTILDKCLSDISIMLSGFEITNYNSDDTDYYLNIVDKIKSNVNNYKSNDGWKTF